MKLKPARCLRCETYDRDIPMRQDAKNLYTNPNVMKKHGKLHRRMGQHVLSSKTASLRRLPSSSSCYTILLNDS